MEPDDIERPAKRPRLRELTVNDQVQPTTQVSSSRPEHQNGSTRMSGTGMQNQNSNVNVGNDLVIINSDTSHHIDNRRQLLLESLAFDQIDSRQASIKKAFRNTCRWFLQTPVYKEWEDKDPSQDENHFLWIKGKPGAGKSTLMKFLYQHLQPKSKKANNVLISFFFNARGHDLEKSTVGLYRSLLVQLLEKQPDLLDTLDIPRRDRDWDRDSLKSLFEQAIQNLEQTPVVCLVDALDECDEVEVREMVDFFADLVCTETRLSICFASRHYPHITIDTGLSIILEIQDKHEEDIATYLGKALRIGQDDLAKEIRLDLQEKASGVFMWVVLVVDILNKEFDAGRKHTLKEKLKKLPDNLHELFLNILTRDSNHQGALLLCIQWVLFAKRPLKPKELYFAILSGYEPEHLETCHSGNISDEDIYKYILNNSKGVVESTKGKTSTIQFIHESVRDFLLKEDGLGQIFPILEGNIYGRSHDALKHCCIAYINAGTKFEAEPQAPTAEITKPELPFLEYAIYNILYHAEQAESNSVSQLEFLTQFPRQEWIRHRNSFEKHESRLYTPNASLSYILAESNTPALIRAQPSRRSLVDVEDERYGLPILAAMATKSSAAVQTMLEIEAEQSETVSWTYFQNFIPASRKNFFTLPTRRFNFNRKRGVEDQLLEHPCEGLLLFLLLTGYVNVDTKDHSGKGLPEIGVIQGYHVLLKEFLKINPSFVTTDRFNRLLFHAENASAATFLLDRGADPSVVDDKGQTPLHDHLQRVSLSGIGEVVRILIKTGCGLSAIDKQGRTPLHRACYSIRAEASQVALSLIEAGADISIADKEGKTPLHHASHHGRVDIARHLMEHGADVSIMDNEGKTPLYHAFFHGTVEVAEQLIEHGADISVVDNEGKTLLHHASSPSHFFGVLKVSKQLIEHGAAVSNADNEGKTPLHYVSSSSAFPGFIEAVKQLIEYSADVSIADNEGMTPLHTVSASSHVYGVFRVAEQLIEHDADVSVVDHQGKTPLHYASSSGHAKVVKHLIEHGADISVVDNQGKTPLHHASSRGDTGLAKLLIEHGADISMMDNMGKTPLHCTADYVHRDTDNLEVAEQLIKHGADVSIRDKVGKSPLDYAMSRNDSKLVKLLQESADEVSEWQI